MDDRLAVEQSQTPFPALLTPSLQEHRIGNKVVVVAGRDEDAETEEAEQMENNLSSFVTVARSSITSRVTSTSSYSEVATHDAGKCGVIGLKQLN